MKLETYKCLSDKEVFKRCKIDTKTNFEEHFKKYFSYEERGNKYFFRGIFEAKYMLYNSAQRAWLSYELDKSGKSYTDFVDKQVIKVRGIHKGLLSTFFKSFGYYPNDLSMLSFLQHYGGATPFLDFTEDIFVALYFAMDGLKHNPSDDEIDNYFSIYVIEDNRETLSNWDNLIKSKLKEIRAIKDLKASINNPFSLSEPFYLKWGVHSIPWKSKTSLIINISRQNLNIINQKGLFVFNPDPIKPLERVLQTNNVICYDIHKSLSEYINLKLTQKGFTKDFIYPQEEEIAKLALLKVRQEL